MYFYLGPVVQEPTELALLTITARTCNVLLENTGGKLRVFSHRDIYHKLIFQSKDCLSWCYIFVPYFDNMFIIIGRINWISVPILVINSLFSSCSYCFLDKHCLMPGSSSFHHWDILPGLLDSDMLSVPPAMSSLYG